jgi:3-phenylpropionate/cinnamic acid dioxygenase small subunit
VTPSAGPSSERAIENLIARYAELVDAGDFAGLGDLLGDGLFGGEGDLVVRGDRAIEGIFRSMVRVYEDGTPRTKHVTTNIQIEVDEALGTATSRSYVTVFQGMDDTGIQPIVAGRYRDRFERKEQEWRFVERRFVTDLLGDVSRHLLHGSDTLRGQP